MEKNIQVIKFSIIYAQAGLSAWQHSAVQTLMASGKASLVTCIQVATPSSKVRSRYSKGLWNSYLRWFYKPSVLRLMNPLEEWKQVSHLTCSANVLATLGPDNAEFTTKVSSCQHDFILNFSGCSVGEELRTVPRLGIWSFLLNGFEISENNPVSFQEILTGAALTSVFMVQLTVAGLVVLRQGVFRTQRASLSHAADKIYTECAHWPADQCRQLQVSGSFMVGAPSPPPVVREFRPPAVGELLSFWGRQAVDKLWQLYNIFLVADQWNIGVVNRPIRDFLQPASLQGLAIETPALPNRNVFYADCFARQEPTGAVIYFELYDYRVRRGNISRLPYPWLPGSTPVPVLDFPYHLSYPFLHGPYCIPEAWMSESIRLYDLREPVIDPAAGQVLLPVPGVDATLLEYDDRYWLFYARTDRDAMLNLFIAYADALHGPWHEHAQNPVKTDIRSARPAGPFFEVAGKLYRPTQDCVSDYGYAINIQEVLTLTTTEYREQDAAYLPSLHPGYPAGMHTLAALDATHTLIDFKRRRFIPMATLIAGWGIISSIVYGKRGRRKPPITVPKLPIISKGRLP